MSNPLGELITAEVGRAETDLAAIRARGQSVLTFSGALVSILAAVIALVVKQAPDSISRFSTGAAGLALGAFVVATLFVLIMYLPAGVDAASSSDLARYAKESWDEPTWEQDVAIVLAKYLLSLRTANQLLGTLLRLAIICEVLGIAAVAVLAVSLLAKIG